MQQDKSRWLVNRSEITNLISSFSNRDYLNYIFHNNILLPSVSAISNYYFLTNYFSYPEGKTGRRIRIIFHASSVFQAQRRM